MNPPRFWCRIGAASLLIAAIAALFFYRSSSSSVVDGKSVTEWLDQISMAPEDSTEAFRAVARLRCEAYPVLLRALQPDLNRVSRFLWSASKQLPEIVSEPLARMARRPEERQMAALRAVEFMGGNDCSDEVQATLIRLLNSPKFAEGSARALLRMGPMDRQGTRWILDGILAHVDEPWTTNQLTVLWTTGGNSGDWCGALAQSTNATWSDVGTLLGAWFSGETNRVLSALDRSVFEPTEPMDLQLGLRRPIRPWVALHLLQLIGPQTTPLVPAWVARLRGSQTQEAREWTVWAMGLVGAEKGSIREVEVLREVIEAEGALDVRIIAIRALGKLGKRSTSVLESLLQGSDEETIQEARQALRRIQATP